MTITLPSIKIVDVTKKIVEFFGKEKIVRIILLHKLTRIFKVFFVLKNSI